MGKKRKEKDGERKQGTVPPEQATIGTDDHGSMLRADGKVSRKAHDQALFNLHAELVKVQRWVQTTGAKSGPPFSE